MKCLNCEGELFENEFKDLQCVDCGSIYPFSNKRLGKNEIVKALYFMRCAADYKDTITINKKTAIGLYDLINRLQAENENYSKNNQTMTSDILKLYKELEQAKAENERLKPLEKFSEFNSHIRVEDMLVFASSLEEWMEFCDNLKAEAYKECIEKVKENSNKMELVCSGALVRIDYTITEEKLDNLLKELERKESTTYDD